MQIEYLSASRLDTYCSCPFKYFLQYHIKLPELKKDTIATHKGSAVHNALEMHCKGSDGEKVLKEYYAENKVWEFDDRKPGKGWKHPVDKNCAKCPWAQHHGNSTICSIAGRDINGFDGCPRPNFEDDLTLYRKTLSKEDNPFARKVIGAEVPFDIKIDNFRIHGYIDLITEVDEETLEVRDYKTGNYAKNTDEALKDFQMRIYSLVAKTLYPQYKFVIMTLDYLRTKPITVIFGKEDDEITRQFLKDSYKKIVNSTDPPRVKSFKCSWCVGYDRCGEIRNSFLDKNGKFVMPPAVESAKVEVDEEV